MEGNLVPSTKSQVFSSIKHIIHNPRIDFVHRQCKGAWDMGRTAAATPPEPADRVLQGLLDRYMERVDDTVMSESLAVSARGYFLAKVAERRCAAEVPSFNNVLKKKRIDQNGFKEAKELGASTVWAGYLPKDGNTSRENRASGDRWGGRGIQGSCKHDVFSSSCR